MSEQFGEIFDASPWPMLMLGEDGRVLAASDEVRVSEAAHDAPLADLPLRDRAAHYVAALGSAMPWLTPQRVDTTRQLPSGAVIHERLFLRPARWGACLTVVDQTEERRLQTADMQVARLASLGFMVAGVCHELTNPLTSLKSNVQFLRTEPRPDQALLQKGLDNIADNVARLLEISRRLLNFSRVGDEPRGHFGVDVVIEEALCVLRQDNLLREVVVHCEADPRTTVFGNAGQIREIFLNLFVNALQAMAGRGELLIAARPAGQRVEITVTDSGPGVPAEAAARIFEPFFTTKAGAQGTGLGLAICAEIVHEHGGTIELANRAAPGASFRVTLPTEAP